MSRIPSSVVEEILDKADIESVVGAYVSYTRKSSQNLFGLCPFHSEKTGSFSVSPSRGICHCFGCGKGGNAINFIMEIEHLTFPEACRFLGQKYGIEVPEDNSYGDDKSRQANERVRQILNCSFEFYKKCYESKAGIDARKYAQNRGLRPETIEKFGIGYAPEGWDYLYQHLKNKGFTDEEMSNSGLFVKTRKGNLIDLFRGRLIIPIYDAFDHLVAFGGRAIKSSDDPANPKYVNSPDSLVYKKQQHLYALNHAKKDRTRKLLIVEGYMDAIAIHQAGIGNAVAALGTAFTDSQLRLSAKFADEIVFFFDSDNAGKKAAIRAVQMMLSYLDKMTGLNIRIKIAYVPDGKDPDEFINKNGVEMFHTVVNNALDVDDYLAERAYSDNCDETGKLDLYKYQEDIVLYASWISDPIKREKIAGKAAEYLHASSNAVMAKIEDRIIIENNRKSEQNAREVRKMREEEVSSRNQYYPEPENYEEIPPEEPEQPQVPVVNGVSVDYFTEEEIKLFILAMKLKGDLANPEYISKEDILRKSDFKGYNMQCLVEFMLTNFKAGVGVKEMYLYNELKKYNLNGQPAEVVYNYYYNQLGEYTEPKIIQSYYLFYLYRLRLEFLERVEKALMRKLNTSLGEEKETIRQKLRNIESYKNKLRSQGDSL